MMSLQLTCTLNTSHTSSVFVKAESWLQTDKHMRCLRHLDSQEEAEDFHSVMDFVYVSVFPHFRDACMAYYEDEGPQLRDMVSPQIIEKMDLMILRVLQCAYELHKEDEQLKWREVLELLTALE